MRKASLTVKNIKKYDFSNLDLSSLDLSRAKFGFELSNDAKCNLDGSTLSCTYNTKSHNPYNQPVSDPNTDYRFTDKIRLEGVKLEEVILEKKALPQINCPAMKPFFMDYDTKLKFTFNDNGKVEYETHYPTYSGTSGEVKTTTDANGTSTTYVKNFSGKTNTEEIDETNKGFFSFFDVNKGGTQAIIRFEEDTFHIQNEGFGNLGSKFSIESVEQPVRAITEEDATLEYNGTYQVAYQTEPDSPQHDLVINIL